MIEEYYSHCIKTGLGITGLNAEVACGQWEYQIFGKGITAGDDASISKYILERTCEKYGVYTCWDPKPIEYDCNGSGLHVNFSTKKIRADGGIKHIEEAIHKLEVTRKEHMAEYGDGNERRLTDKHETADINKFSWGVGNRGASIRIGNQTSQDGKGYFEDRRPASSADPYRIINIMLKTVVLDQ